MKNNKPERASKLKNDKIYYPEVTPSITKDLEKLARRATERDEGRYRQEPLLRREQKHARMLSSKTDKYIHALEILIEKAEEAKSPTAPVDYGKVRPSGEVGFSIDYYNFNFEDRRDAAELFENFLNQLKVDGCVKNWERNPFTPSVYVFGGVNLDKLKRYRNRRKERGEWTNTSLYFGFNGQKFWLRLLDGGTADIDFHLKKGEGTDTFHLMQALVQCLKIYGEKQDSWASVVCSRKSIIDYIQKEFKVSLGSDTDYWLKSTRGNLVKKIPEAYQDLIKIGTYAKKMGGYLFKLKLPI